MDIIARVLGLSLVVGAAGGMLGYGFFHSYGDASIPSLVLACIGAIVGALAGSANEIAAALRRKPSNPA